jgi:hypothetical protein
MSKIAKCIFLIVAGIGILVLVGCPGGKNPSGKTNSPGTVQESGNTVEETPAGGTDRGEQVSGSETDDTLGVPVTGYKPTQDKPLAPPSPPAEGSENVPEGTLELVVSLSGPDDVKVPLKEGARVTVGDKMDVQISLVNSTSEKVEIVFPTSQKIDIIATDSNGREVYRWSRDKRFPAVVNTLPVETGSSWSHEITITIGTGEFMLAPGTYKIEVVLTGSPEIKSEAENVRISVG